MKDIKFPKDYYNGLNIVKYLIREESKKSKFGEKRLWKWIINISAGGMTVYFAILIGIKL